MVELTSWGTSIMQHQTAKSENGSLSKTEHYLSYIECMYLYFGGGNLHGERDWMV